MASNKTFWALEKQAAYSELAATEAGLSMEEAAIRLKKYGPNSFNVHRRHSGFFLFLRQFKSPITILLIIAALLSMGLNDFTNALIILFIILVSSLLGFWQEKGATNAIFELQKLVQIRCSVVRNGSPGELPLEQVVPGDIVILNAGDIIPADSLLLESKELFVDEAAFTGETFPVEKNPGIMPEDAPLAKRSNAVFMGSHVISGTGNALVVNTGRETEFGKISAILETRIPETEFEKGIRHFGYMLMEITLVLVLIIFAINVLLHRPALDSILFSLALAVGLTPQLLPAIISINLSVGAKLMARNQVIVKRLSAIENLGSMNILCADKTGTITAGKVILKAALDVEGNSSKKTLKYAWLNASLQRGFNNPIDEAIKASQQDDAGAIHVQTELPYDFIRKRLTIQINLGDENIVITKGALKAVIEICNRAETANGELVSLKDKQETINHEYERLSADGYRVLGVAYKNGSSTTDFTRKDEKDLIFLGFITLYDPPKTDVFRTIRELNNSGVTLKLITGDNALVAQSIAEQVGFEKPNILTGVQMRKMSESALQHQALLTDIFAEVEPNQKEKIILLLKKSGNVVGFLGDGINDAPALHAADVGISVDSAVDVAKEAADIVLLEQSLEVLKTGIMAGRKTFTNTMKYIFMATSANFGNMFSMAGASLFLPFLPLLPKQILLANLLTDFPEMTIASDRVDESAITKPQRWNIRFIQRFIMVFGLISSIFDFITFGVLLYFMNADENLFRTGWFLESLVSAIMVVLVMRTRLPFFKSLPGTYLSIASGCMLVFALILPQLPFAPFLGFTPLPISFYGWMLLIVAVYVISVELAKHWFFRNAH